MDGKSLNLREESIKQLNKIFPDVFSDGKIDLERLKDLVGANSFTQGEHYELTWIDKTKARQEIQKQTKATLKTDREGSIDFDTAQNVFIEGDNLEVLKILQKSYFGKIKMIYIDPPYNTGNDSFMYKDDETEREGDYLQRNNIKDEEGFVNHSDKWYKNSKDSVLYHSSWLSMMYPRLYLAGNLLKEDGFIFISIDDGEYSNLKLMGNEIFGEENFVGNFIWKRNKSGTQNSKHLSVIHEYTLVYRKSDNATQWYESYDSDDLKDYNLKDKDGIFYWKTTYHSTLGTDVLLDDGIVIKKSTWGKSKMLQEMKKGNAEIRIKKEEYILYGKQRPSEGKLPYSLLATSKASLNEKATAEVSEILSLSVNEAKKFTPKPKQLIKYYLDIINDSDGIILDFFAGSSTTAQAVLELNEEDNGNRKFIMVQIDEEINKDSEAKKTGYDTIADISKARIKKVIENIKKEREGKLNFEEKQQLSFAAYKRSPSNFKQWNEEEAREGQGLNEQLSIHLKSEKEGFEQEDMIVELILKSGYELTVPRKYYQPIPLVNVWSVNEDEMWIYFNPFKEDLKKAIAKYKPTKVILLDSCFRKR